MSKIVTYEKVRVGYIVIYNKWPYKALRVTEKNETDQTITLEQDSPTKKQRTITAEQFDKTYFVYL